MGEIIKAPAGALLPCPQAPAPTARPASPARAQPTTRAAPAEERRRRPRRRWGKGCACEGMHSQQVVFEKKRKAGGDLLQIQSPELMLTLRHIVEPFSVSNEPNPLTPVITKNHTRQIYHIK